MLAFQILISKIAGPEIMFILVTIVATFLYKKNNTRDFYTILFTSSFAMITTYTIKHLLKIPRPDTMLIPEVGYRFPSGHATMAALVMSLGIYYAHRYVHDKQLRYFLYISAVAWYILISYSRIYLHVHFLIDVIAGGIVGVLSTIIVVKIVRRFYSHKG